MIPDRFSPTASIQAEADLLLPSLALPDAVQAGLREALRNSGGNSPPGGQTRLPESWRLAGTATGGHVLFHQPPGSTARRWVFADRFGRLHGLLRWNEGGNSLRGMALRLPDGAWCEIKPAAGQHALWGASDLLMARKGAAAHEAETRETVRFETGCFEAVDYGRISHIPPLANPGALPPGAGEALLNTLAMLLCDQGQERVHYRGPYATEHLFDSLERSFTCLQPGNDARAEYSRGEFGRALAGEIAESPVSWRPAPFEPVQPEDDLLVAVKDGVQAVWLGGAPYRRQRGMPGGGSLPGVAPLSGGARVWRDEAAREARYRVGLVLLGAPYRVYRTLDAQGGVAEPREQSPAESQADSLENLPCSEPRAEPAPAQWGEAVFAWAARNCTPALAPAILAMAPRLPVAMAHLPHGVAEIRDGWLLLQAGAFAQFHRLRNSQEDSALALMLISDLLSGAAPILRRRAQAELAANPPPDMAALYRQGESATQAAGKTLERAVPALLKRIVEGADAPPPADGP